VIQFFFYFGPNTTTFIIAAEMFPTKFRSRCFAIAASIGKVGAILSQIIFTRIELNNALHLFILVTITGYIFTIFVPKTDRKTLEDLNENVEKQLETNELE
jgi:MFS transporter, PHS family, inorganic phosphate transporter